MRIKTTWKRSFEMRVATAISAFTSALYFLGNLIKKAGCLIRDIGKPKRSIALSTMLAIGMLGLLGLIMADGFSLHYQLDNLKNELAIAKRDVRTANENMMSLQRDVSQIRQDQSSAADMLTGLEDRLSAMPPNSVLQITAVEGRIIREFFMRLDGLQPMVEAGYKVGETVGSDQLLDFSVLLTEKLPKLKNTRYTIDTDSSIIIVSRERNRIVAILSNTN